MRSKAIAMCLFLVVLGGAGAESLWDPGFNGVSGGNTSLKKGDVVLVVLDGKTSLKVTSGRIDSKRVTLEMSSGEADGLFSFLPTANSGGNMSFKGNEELSLVARIAARVDTVPGGDAVFIKGTRLFSVDGAQSSVSVSGWIRQRDLTAAGEVSVDKLADAVIIYETAASGSRQVLSGEDLLKSEPKLGSGSDTFGEASAETGTGGDAAMPGSDTGNRESSLSLTPEKRRELLLKYVNSFVELLF